MSDTRLRYSGFPQAGEISSGAPIFNKRFSAKFGTAGCILKHDASRKKYLLTCNHVLNNERFENNFNRFDSVLIKKPGEDIVVGTWSFGIMDDIIDLALVEIQGAALAGLRKQDFQFDEDFDVHKLLMKHVQLTGLNYDDIDGYVVEINKSFDMEYKNGTRTLSNTIFLAESTNENNPISITRGGDSGAIVIDSENKNVVGMVVGGNDFYTCVIPFSSFRQILLDRSLSIY
ncbi:MAG: hypothetical protein ACHQFW_10545 [Chitinophagales bacterium]